MMGSGVAKHRSLSMRSRCKHSGDRDRILRALGFSKLRAARSLLLLVVVLLSAPLRAQAVLSPEIVALELPSGEEARPTLAWTKFCEGLPDECAENQSEPPTIHLTQAV